MKWRYFFITWAGIYLVLWGLIAWRYYQPYRAAIPTDSPIINAANAQRLTVVFEPRDAGFDNPINPQVQASTLIFPTTEGIHLFDLARGRWEGRILLDANRLDILRDPLCARPLFTPSMLVADTTATHLVVQVFIVSSCLYSDLGRRSLFLWDRQQGSRRALPNELGDPVAYFAAADVWIFTHPQHGVSAYDLQEITILDPDPLRWVHIGQNSIYYQSALTGEIRRILPDLSTEIVTPSLGTYGLISDSERWLVYADQAGSYIYDLTTHQTWALPRSINMRQSSGMAFSPDDQWLALAHLGGKVELWDTARQRISVTLHPTDNEGAWTLAFGALGDVVIGVRGNVVRVWDMRGQILKQLELPRAWHVAPQLVMDGRLILLGSGMILGIGA